MGTSAEHKALFGDAFMQDAVLELYCRAAKLTNSLFGDNVADCTAMSEKEM